MTSARSTRLPMVLLGLVMLVLVWSGVGPHDRLTWLLEVVPVLIAVPLLLLSARTFPLTTLAYVLIALHAVILMYGGHYTYALTPLGDWMQEAFHFSRNHYDRIGHLMQGFGPAIIARELLLRTSPMRPGKWLFTIVTLSVLGISACYEFTEWWAALAAGDAAAAFLGTQGDVWDTQWDMFLAGCGAIAAQLILRRVHDRQLAAHRSLCSCQVRDTAAARRDLPHQQRNTSDERVASPPSTPGPHVSRPHEEIGGAGDIRTQRAGYRGDGLRPRGFDLESCSTTDSVAAVRCRHDVVAGGRR